MAVNQKFSVAGGGLMSDGRLYYLPSEVTVSIHDSGSYGSGSYGDRIFLSSKYKTSSGDSERCGSLMTADDAIEVAKMLLANAALLKGRTDA